MFGDQAASRGGISPDCPSALKRLIIPQNKTTRPIEIKMPDRAPPRLAVLKEKGRPRSVITRGRKGKLSFQ